MKEEEYRKHTTRLPRMKLVHYEVRLDKQTLETGQTSRKRSTACGNLVSDKGSTSNL